MRASSRTCLINFYVHSTRVRKLASHRELILVHRKFKNEIQLTGEINFFFEALAFDKNIFNLFYLSCKKIQHIFNHQQLT